MALELDTFKVPLTAPAGTPSPLLEAYDAGANALFLAAQFRREPPTCVTAFEDSAVPLTEAYRKAKECYEAAESLLLRVTDEKVRYAHQEVLHQICAVLAPVGQAMLHNRGQRQRGEEVPNGLINVKQGIALVRKGPPFDATALLKAMREQTCQATALVAPGAATQAPPSAAGIDSTHIDAAYSAAQELGYWSFLVLEAARKPDLPRVLPDGRTVPAGAHLLDLLAQNVDRHLGRSNHASRILDAADAILEANTSHGAYKIGEHVGATAHKAVLTMATALVHEAWSCACQRVKSGQLEPQSNSQGCTATWTADVWPTMRNVFARKPLIDWHAVRAVLEREHIAPLAHVATAAKPLMPGTAQEQDGPEAPNFLRWKGKRHEIRRQHYLILGVLWGKEKVKEQEVIDAVWGHDNDVPDSTFKSLLSHLNTKLQELGIPWEYRRKAGYVVMDSFLQVPQQF